MSSQALAELPADAKKMLKTFPGERITLDLVVGRAVEASDSFSQVKSLAATIDIAELTSLAQTDTRFSATGAREINRNEPSSPFGTNKLFTTRFNLGASSYFTTGTTATAELGSSRTLLGLQVAFPPSPSIYSYYETRGALTLTQNLWQDAFGYGGRRAKEAGRLMTQAARFGFEEAVEDWVLQLVQVYYDAWYSQAQAKVADAHVKLNERLTKITGIKLNRGTAEQPDFLQAKSNLMNARVQSQQASQVLGDRWRNLVLSLKLPDDWVNIDPKELPIELDQPIDASLKACGLEGTWKGTTPKNSSTTRKIELQAQAAKLSAERAMNGVAPDVELFGSVVPNGIDSASLGNTLTETRKLDHPAWTVGLNVVVSLGQYAERAAAHQAVADLDRLDAAASASQSDLKLEWLNSCANLKRLNDSYALLNEAYEAQSRRASLEEERFRIGRTTTLNVIQAANDALSAESALRGNEVTRRIAAWRVRRLALGYRAYLSSLKGSQQ